ncbi:MAG: DNA translocase FtsK [Rhodocyclaceae bacterium]
MHEARWLVLAACAAYFAIVLVGYDRADPGWSHAGAEHVANPGGRFGAWLADVLLYLFGLSAWWWVAFFAFLVVLGYRRLGRQGGTDRRPFVIALAGFAVLLASSSGLEALRFHSARAALPFLPGGVTGYEVARLAHRYLGFTGGTLLLLGLMAASFSLFSGLSWIELAERTGALLERVAAGIRLAWEKWRDRRIGREVAERREGVIEHERRRQQTHEPLRIAAAELELPRSERVERERQKPLFEDMPENLLPPLALLDESSRDAEPPSPETLEFTSRLIERKLGDFGVEVKVLAALPGPVITRYEIEPAVGVKGSQIVNLVKDLARALSVVSIRVIETIPGKSCMGLEIPNARRQIVHLSEILGSVPFHEMHSPLALALGKDIGGAPVVADLARMPHLLVAGTTGSGKSVAINAMILSLLYKSEPDAVKLILVDPKMLELSAYEGIPHLAAPVVTDMRHAANALAWCVGEMEHRYKRMSALAVRNLSGYNHKIREAEKAGKPIDDPLRADASQPAPLRTMPHVVVVIDELADLMMVAGKKVEELIARLAQKARAAGIHLILATQRPSVDVITGLIKANIPTRIAFQVSARVDSRTILDQSGADALLGQGDMLFLMAGSGVPVRVHGAFVADGEVQRVVDYLKRFGKPDYVEGILDDPVETQSEADAEAAGEDDPLYDQAVEIVLRTRRPSISLVQRHLRIGYNRAARLIEQMERSGLVSAMGANGNREVLAPAQD